LPGCDLLTAGFPCQPFSSLGQQKGFLDPNKGHLFWQIIRVLRRIRPAACLLENVPGLLKSDGGHTMDVIVSELSAAGKCLMSTVCCLLCCLLSAVCCLLSVICCLLSAVCHLSCRERAERRCSLFS
jgi:hypothetical protein